MHTRHLARKNGAETETEEVPEGIELGGTAQGAGTGAACQGQRSLAHRTESWRGRGQTEGGRRSHEGNEDHRAHR